MSLQDPIVIIGGGIGGLAAALALSHKGFKTLLIEQAEEFCQVPARNHVGS